MNGVEMPEDQDAGLAAMPERECRAHTIAEAHATRDALDSRASGCALARGDIHHGVDTRRVESRTFALDSRAQARQHRLGVERQCRDVHEILAGMDRHAATMLKECGASNGKRLMLDP